MNSALKASPGANNVNVGPEDQDTIINKRKSRGSSSASNPLSINNKKKGIFGDSPYLMDDSYGSSSSYGSIDEESFVRKLTPDDFK